MPDKFVTPCINKDDLALPYLTLPYHYRDLVLNTKTILLRTTSNLSYKVDNYTHFKRLFSQFELKWNIW